MSAEAKIPGKTVHGARHRVGITVHDAAGKLRHREKVRLLAPSATIYCPQGYRRQRASIIAPCHVHTYEVSRFLIKRNFYHKRTSGSHHIYECVLGDEVFTVIVPYHDRKGVVKPGTMKSIISQSGIPQEEWLT